MKEAIPQIEVHYLIEPVDDSSIYYLGTLSYEKDNKYSKELLFDGDREAGEYNFEFWIQTDIKDDYSIINKKVKFKEHSGWIKEEEATTSLGPSIIDYYILNSTSKKTTRIQRFERFGIFAKTENMEENMRVGYYIKNSATKEIIEEGKIDASVGSYFNKIFGQGLSNPGSYDVHIWIEKVENDIGEIIDEEILHLEIYTSYVSDDISNLNKENRIGLISGIIYVFDFQVEDKYFFLSEDCGSTFERGIQRGSGDITDRTGGFSLIHNVKPQILTYENSQETLELLDKALEDCEKEKNLQN